MHIVTCPHHGGVRGDCRVECAGAYETRNGGYGGTRSRNRTGGNGSVTRGIEESSNNNSHLRKPGENDCRWPFCTRATPTYPGNCYGVGMIAVGEQLVGDDQVLVPWQGVLMPRKNMRP